MNDRRFTWVCETFTGDLVSIVTQILTRRPSFVSGQFDHLTVYTGSVSYRLKGKTDGGPTVRDVVEASKGTSKDETEDGREPWGDTVNLSVEGKLVFV